MCIFVSEEKKSYGNEQTNNLGKKQELYLEEDRLVLLV